MKRFRISLIFLIAFLIIGCTKSNKTTEDKVTKDKPTDEVVKKEKLTRCQLAFSEDGIDINMMIDINSRADVITSLDVNFTILYADLGIETIEDAQLLENDLETIMRNSLKLGQLKVKAEKDAFAFTVKLDKKEINKLIKEDDDNFKLIPNISLKDTIESFEGDNGTCE